MALKTVEIAKAFTLTRDDGSQKFYPVGLHVMPEYDAEHWYTKGHIAAAPPPKLGDLAFAEALRAEADRRRAAWLEADEQAAEAEAAYLATQAPQEDAEEHPPEGDNDSPPDDETAARIAAEEEAARIAAEAASVPRRRRVTA